MRKSELIARVEHYNESELIEIQATEYMDVCHANNLTNEDIQFHELQRGTASVNHYAIDGWNYYWYSASWSVGWQGDIDGDSYFCKQKTLTKAELQEIHDLFTTQA